MDLPIRLDQRPHRPASRNDFEIAILCALPLEADAVDHLFDHRWKEDGITYDKAPGDSNHYVTGTIHRHNVVLAYMPDEGKVNGAVVATNCRMSFRNIRLALVVGVCAAVPFVANGPEDMKHEIILGDVIISNGVVEYDHGRMQPEGFKRKATVLDNLGRPNQKIRAFLRMLKGVRAGRELRQAMYEHLSRFETEPELEADYPGPENDKLFPAVYQHVMDGKSCDEGGCTEPLVQRRRLQQQDLRPRVHIGHIASGDMVMKSSYHRDIIVEEEKVIAFEMESAGVWDVFPCVVIKGACDYADSHKTKGWQRYAAATAASCMKAFLGEWVPSNLQTISAPAPSSSTVTAELSTAQPAVVTTKTVVFCVPLPVNPRFVGRTQILNELQTKLFDNDNGKIALVGLAGVGKTQIALQLAVYVRDKMKDRSVFWLSALSMPSFEQSCRLIMKQCGLKDSDSKDPKAIVQDYLSSERAGRWLLIVDNADDKSLLFGSDEDTECIEKHLPQSASGLMLFTTRSRQVANAAAQCAENIVPVWGMSDQEAREHLGKKISQSELNRNEEATKSLLQRLTNLPLAITQAAAYINKNQISIETYLDLFDNTDAVQLISNHFNDDTRYKESDNAVATTLLVSFRQISETNKLAARLLTFLAWIEPKGIPLFIFPEAPRQDMVQAIGMLRGYSFLVEREERDVFDMHTLVHMVTHTWARKQDISGYSLPNTIAHLNQIFPNDDWENRDRWRQLLPHALKTLSTAQADLDPEGCRLGLCVGRCLRSDGHYPEACQVLCQVVAVQKGNLPSDDPKILASQHTLAMAYRLNGQIGQAIEILEHVTKIEAQTLQEGHPDRLASQHELGSAYLENGQVEEAIKLLEYVVNTRAQILQEEHPDRLASQHDLGSAYLENRQVEEAIKLLEYVVNTRAQILQKEHPDRLASQHDLGRAYLENGQVEEAIKLLEYVVNIQAQTLQEGHPDRLASQHELGRAYLENGQVEEPIKLLEHVVNIQAQTLQEGHPERLASQHMLACALYQRGQTRKAIELLEHVVRMRKATVRDNHPSRVIAEQRLQRWYSRNGIDKEV